jgi:hypothetical protein
MKLETFIKVPTDVAVSPENGGDVRFVVDRRMFLDDVGNTWTVDELAASRPANAIRKWIDENYPKVA